MELGTVRMMGVIANSKDESIVREFFELFKIPWEYYQQGRQYQTVLCSENADVRQVSAKLVLLFAGGETAFDLERNVRIQTREKGSAFTYRKRTFPIYDYGITFRGTEGSTAENAGTFIRIFDEFTEKTTVRVGYNLFREVEILLTAGQPSSHGGTPTLDLHIALLRDLITGCGIPLVEIPPLPDGYSYIACLTHDVDHASVRRHKFDNTIFGFLYRSTIGSVINVGRGRMPFRHLLTNWMAAAKLPLVYLGVVDDFWLEFDRYTEIENGKPSTFFFVPFENHPGLSPDGSAPESRATRYDISHVAGKIPKLIAAGCEIGLHGIDAWADSDLGRREAQRISSFTGASEVGVRMHWLYWSAGSPVTLEDAGFSYDSTGGYNETVGYLAGTSQVFKPLGAKHMLELPLHVMDTALFNGGRMNLSPLEAWGLVNQILENTASYGGVLTINWHDRSIAPERLWEEFYSGLLARLEAGRPWFSTAGQAVSWFQKRRDAVFEKVEWQDGKLHVRVASSTGGNLPDLRLRFHRPGSSEESVAAIGSSSSSYTDTGFNGSVDTRFQNC